MSHIFHKTNIWLCLMSPGLLTRQVSTSVFHKQPYQPPPGAAVSIRKKPWVPPPDSDPCLVREDAILKSIVLHDQTYPIKLSRLQDIADSPTGWVNRMVPPPELAFEMKRNDRQRFDIDIHRKGRRKQTYTTIKNIQGDIKELEKCLKWRFGKHVYYLVLEKPKRIVLGGFHKRSVNTLLQALGF